MRRQGECVGVELGFGQDIELTLSRFLQAGFDFIAAPLTNPLYRPSKVTESPYEASSSIPPPFAGSDLVLTPAQWSGHIVGKISSWIDLDSNDEIVRTDSETTLKKEVSWAAHLSLQAIILPTPARPLDCGNYACCVNRILQQVSNMQLWLRMPLVSPKLQKAEGTPEEDSVYLERDPMTGKLVSDTWEWWNMFRMLCDHHSHLCVALDITESLPPQSAIARWMGEPVKAAILHTSAFLTNKKGYPCLSKHHQSLITTFLDHSVQVIITGEAGHEVDAIALVAPASENANGSEESAVLRHALKPYQEYIAFLYRHMKPLTEQERLELGYRDFLQAPLQPLMDNLEAQTYETFEKDATKYTQYQKAVHAALLDRVSDKDASTTTTVLMVVGAGRGPLVRASLQAAEETGRKLRVYAVEKNPNAVVTLHSLVKLQGWADIVTVVSCDMRHWNAPEKADIMVSELLGSFGDNELSPECLDGAQRFLKEDGISIPSSYTSFIAPITASKLYNDVKAYNDVAHFETAYVVKLHSVARLTPPQPVFSFFHPNLSRNIDNERYKQLVFELPVEAGSSLIHGFAGYFDSTLYKDIHLGIEPSTATPNMFSWFAIFFPLSKPVYVPVDSKMEVHFWRCVGETKVWYEWAVTAPSVSPIHNSNGRSYSVGL